jgi:hypothetical protein
MACKVVSKLRENPSEERRTCNAVDRNLPDGRCRMRDEEEKREKYEKWGRRGSLNTETVSNEHPCSRTTTSCIVPWIKLPSFPSIG